MSTYGICREACCTSVGFPAEDDVTRLLRLPFAARFSKVTERLPVVKRATEAVNFAEGKMRRLKLDLFERDARIQELNQELAAAGLEVERTRDRADKLEERFTQV